MPTAPWRETDNVSKYTGLWTRSGGWGDGVECPDSAEHEFKEGFLEEVRSVRRLYLEDEGPEGL